MQNVMTPRCREILEKELQIRTNQYETKVRNDLEEARSHGDLKENSEYSAAREAQQNNNIRVDHIRQLLSVSEVIDLRRFENVTPKLSHVVFGSKVTFKDLASGEVMTQRLVSEEEAKTDGYMNYMTPVAQALMCKTVGSKAPVEIVVEGVSHKYEYEILDIVYDVEEAKPEDFKFLDHLMVSF